MEPEKPINYDQPVAYDVDGKPLYAHPPTTQGVGEVVQVTHPFEPKKQILSKSIKDRHDKSKDQYPMLNLSEGEYVISAIRRHPIGLIIPLGVGVLLIALAWSLIFNYDIVVQVLALQGGATDSSVAVLPVLLFSVVVALGMYIVYFVYTSNRFFLTNEAVIQEIQVSLFSRLEQTVSLSNIEDASFTQKGIMQYLFNYGSIRLSTEGDETTYRFTYVANPKFQIIALNNAAEAFKNGRPVSDSDN